MALLHTQQRGDQGPSIPVLPTLGFGRHSPVHGVRACDQVRMFDDLPVINWPGAAHSNPGLFSIQFAFGGFLPRLERNRAVLSPRGAARPFPGLSQNDPYHRVQSAPCHILKRLSSARVERHHESTSERTQSWVSRSKDAFSL